LPTGRESSKINLGSKVSEVINIRRVDLRMNEEEKYLKIKELVEHGGNKRAAALKLGCTVRTINRQIKGYKERGKAFFVHGNRGRKPAHALSDGLKRDIIDLYRTKYHDANFEFYTELLASKENICVSAGTVRKTLTDEGIPSPQANRATKRRIKKELKAREAATKSKKEKTAIRAKIVDLEDAHPRRPRCANFGEMLQPDASLHVWFGTEKSTLHIAVDDATGMIVGAYFDRQETLDGYYNVFSQILTEYGIPYMFFTNRRTVFEYKKKCSAEVAEDTFTQFGYACKILGVEIKTSSVPQAKGRVERIFGTLQKRLPILMRLADVATTEQANAFLNSYVREYNAKFALAYDHIASVFEKQPDKEKINLTLSVLTKRKADGGHSVRFNNRYYGTVNAQGCPVHFRKGTEGTVIRAFDGSLYFCVEETVYALEEIPDHEIASRNFGPAPHEKTPKPRYIPPMDHPWKAASFDRFVKKQAHRAELPA
jgi:transposase